MSASARRMTQEAPWPDQLEELVDHVAYKPGWTFLLVDEDRDGGQAAGLTLHISVVGHDSYHPERQRGVVHAFIVPAATYDRRAWRSWLLARIADVDLHERAEFFQDKGERPYAPNHGAGRDPYVLVEQGTAADAATLPGAR